MRSTSLSLSLWIGSRGVDVTFYVDGHARTLAGIVVPFVTLDTPAITQNRAHNGLNHVGDYNVRDGQYSLATYQKGAALSTGREAVEHTVGEWLAGIDADGNAFDHPLRKGLNGLTVETVAAAYGLNEQAVAA